MISYEPGFMLRIAPACIRLAARHLDPHARHRRQFCDSEPPCCPADATAH